MILPRKMERKKGEKEWREKGVSVEVVSTEAEMSSEIPSIHAETRGRKVLNDSA
jgi:hypothetical protein